MVDVVGVNVTVVVVELLMVVVVLVTAMDLWLGKWLYIVVNHRDAGQRGLAVVGVPAGRRREN